MTISELKALVEKHRAVIKKSEGMVVWGPNGPVGLPLIDALVAAIELQQKQIDDLERRVAGLT